MEASLRTAPNGVVIGHRDKFCDLEVLVEASYRSTQFGTVAVVGLGTGVVFLGYQVLTTGWQLLNGLLLLLLLAGLALYHSLTIEIREGSLACSFGPGLIRRDFPLEEIVEARHVRNHWYNGFGIRRTASGWMYNVSGLDAVEITLRSGKHFRMGTDRPAEVVKAITDALNQGI